MNRLLWVVPSLLLVVALAGVPPVSLQGLAPDENPLVLVTSVDVGGRPSAIVVDHDDGRNDIVFYDGDRVRFLDGDSLAVAPQQIVLPTREWVGWMVYDQVHHLTYVLTTRLQETPMHVFWTEVQIHVIADRSTAATFSVNASQNADPSNPSDPTYAVAGLVLKQPLSEGGNPGRVIVDDAENGNVDVIDLDAAGTAVARAQRYSYRDPVTGFLRSNAGNTLALDAKHETLPSDDLADTDLVFIADKNRKEGAAFLEGRIRTIRLNHPMEALDPTPLPDVDLSGTWPFGNGNEGIAVAGARDVLYVASGQQSFDDGFIAEVNTTEGALGQLITLPYGDLGFVHVDWLDPRRVFVATFDGWYNDEHQGLYLHLAYDGAVIDSLRLMDNYDEYDGLRGMDFDPDNRRLYMTVGSSILVVQVNYGQEPVPTCPTPLTGVEIAGPHLCQIDRPYTFRAHPTPSDATLPVTYTWSPEPLTGQRTSIVTYQWATMGTYSISVTAENCGGTCSAVHAVRLGDWEHIFLPLVTR